MQIRNCSCDIGVALFLALVCLAQTISQAASEVPEPAPLASIDLMTREGIGLMKGDWRYRDVKIIPIKHRAPDGHGQPTGAAIDTFDIDPHAGGADFDDESWERIVPQTLQARRSGGRLCFNWYRINISVPERVGDVPVGGSTIVFETAVDDYAEIWVDGELPRRLGQSGGSVIRGWNAPNRLVIARNAQPGRRIQLAIFGANGPLSDPPANFIWMRSARLEFYPTEQAEPRATPVHEVNVEVIRLHPELMDAIVPENPKLYKLAEGFDFTEGPVWMPGGYLLFSDPNRNRIYKYDPNSALRLSVFREFSGYAGADIGKYGQPGSNGLAVDGEGRLTIDQHGNRRVIRLENDGRETVLADRYGGKRFNSPNDLVYRSDGNLYFTDPYFGLPELDKDPRKELPFSGLFRVRDGKVELLAMDLKGPNGLAFSPDEKFLYVGNWDEQRKVVMRYLVMPDGTLDKGSVFFDMTPAKGEAAIDGIKVDSEGNLYVSGPGGLWIISPAGRHLGTIRTPRHVHNLAWGGNDGRTLYLTAQSALYRMPLKTGGRKP